jgi:hypothetical protein
MSPFLIAFARITLLLSDYRGSDSRRSDRAQSTVEYALVMVGVGALAVLIFKWLGSSGLMENLFGAIISKLMPK